MARKGAQVTVTEEDAPFDGETPEQDAVLAEPDIETSDDDEDGQEEVLPDDDDDDEESDEPADDDDEDDDFLGTGNPLGAGGRADDGAGMGVNGKKRFRLAEAGLDLDDEDMEGPPIIPPGKYPGKLTEIEFGESKSSGKDMFTFIFTGTAGKAKNGKFWLYATMDKTARWKYVETMKALGITTKAKLLDFEESEVVGKPVVLVITNEEDNRPEEKGTMRHKLKKVLPPDDEAIKANLVGDVI